MDCIKSLPTHPPNNMNPHFPEALQSCSSSARLRVSYGFVCMYVCLITLFEGKPCIKVGVLGRASESSKQCHRCIWIGVELVVNLSRKDSLGCYRVKHAATQLVLTSGGRTKRTCPAFSVEVAVLLLQLPIRPASELAQQFLVVLRTWNWYGPVHKFSVTGLQAFYMKIKEYRNLNIGR